MPNLGTITVENPAEILNAGAYGAGALIRVQTAATQAGAFADLAGTGSTPTIPIVDPTRSYTFYDPNGIVSSWYRCRYENVGASRLSDWLPAFQVGDETAGLICSTYDVEQRLGQTLTANDRELVLDLIRGATDEIEEFTGRWFTPRPLNGTTTYRFHTRPGRTLRLPRGIRSITTLGIASTGQPDTGGAYTVADPAGYYLDPPDGDRTAGWPATFLRLRYETGLLFYSATFGAEITGGFGWAAVPARIQAIGADAVVRRWLGKTRAAPSVALGPDGGVALLRGISPEDSDTLARYRVPKV